MKRKEKQNVKALVGNILVEGVIIYDSVRDCLSIASIDADILVPLFYCYQIRKCTRKDIKSRTPEQKVRVNLIKEKYIKVNTIFRRK